MTGATQASEERPFAARVREACASEVAGHGWDVVDEPGDEWTYARPAEAATPSQGWKLHVSATTSSAPAVLECVLPTLVRDRAAFKVAASPSALSALNQGDRGLSQVGKFVTVYPADETEAVRLALALDDATTGLTGPAVASDRPLRPGSLVHYRYGGFDGRRVMTLLGEVLPAIEVDGELVPDRRAPSYIAPARAQDPFIAAGVTAEPGPGGRVLAGRYALIATLNRSARGAVHLAIDVQSPRRCVVKVASANAMEAGGLDAHTRLRREADVLRLLSDDPRFPRVLDVHDREDLHLLVLEDVEGETLERHVMDLACEGRHVPIETLLAWGGQLASILETIHEHGLVYTDLKSSNLIISPENDLKLLDLELAAYSAEAIEYRFGTRGYSSPQQVGHAPSSIADDVYGLGAVLYFIATAAEPYAAPDEYRLLARPLELVNPAAGSGLGRVISRSLESAPSRRYASARAVGSALRRAARSASRTPPPFGAEAPGVDEAEARARSLDAAARLADSLHATAGPSGTGGPCWTSTHPVAGRGSPHLNAGSAGPVLVYAELARVLGGDARFAFLGEAARDLSLQTPLPGAQPAGLYVGEAGVAAALLYAGLVLDDAELISRAVCRGHEVALLPVASPDLFHGIAGRVRAHLLFWDAIADADQLTAAVRGGEHLLATAEHPADSELCWRITEGYGPLSGQVQLGYAHGAAGIGDVLLELYAVTGESRFRDGAESALRWLERQARPALDDGSGAGWPASEGGPQAAPFWCHGATGIGRFLLRAAESDLDGSASLLERAARSAARGARWAGPTLCHGLAGNIELLLDVYRFTGDHACLAEARSLASLLDAFAIERDGLPVWPSEHPRIVSPDYMVGFAGVAAAMLRLSDPEALPHLLSRESFAAARSVDFATSAAKLAGRDA